MRRREPSLPLPRTHGDTGAEEAKRRGAPEGAGEGDAWGGRRCCGPPTLDSTLPRPSELASSRSAQVPSSARPWLRVRHARSEAGAEEDARCGSLNGEERKGSDGEMGGLRSRGLRFGFSLASSSMTAQAAVGLLEEESATANPEEGPCCGAACGGGRGTHKDGLWQNGELTMGGE